MTITICTSQFLSLLQATAGSKGYPNLLIISVPHPIAGIKRGEIEIKADIAFGEILKIIEFQGK